METRDLYLMSLLGKDVAVSHVPCKLTNCVSFPLKGCRELLFLVQGMKRYIFFILTIGEVSLILFEKIERFTRHLLKGLMGLNCL